MEKNVRTLTRRERRRSKQFGKQLEKETKDNENASRRQSTVSVRDQQVKPRKVQALGRVVRKDTFTIPKPRSKENSSEDTKTYDLPKEDDNLIILSDPDESKNLTHTLNKNSKSDSKNLTYQLEKEVENTYNVSKKEEKPIPAPRRQKPTASKTSSDTDKDVVDIDFDDGKDKDEESAKDDVSFKASRTSFIATDTDDSIEAVILPKPKPRRRSSPIKETRRDSLKKSKSLEELDREENQSRDVKSDMDTGKKKKVFFTLK